MGLGQALTSAVSGLRVTQSALSIVSGNIANAQTPGYVKKTVSQVSAASANITIGVRLSGVNRTLDSYLQTQLRTEASGGSYAGSLSAYYGRLQAVFGQPGSDNALATTAVLRDKRDQAIDQLAQLMNIKVVEGDNNKINIFSGAGTQLVGDTAVTLKFDAKGSLTPAAVWDADPAKRSVGTITIDSGA